MKLNFDHDNDGVRSWTVMPYDCSASRWSRFALIRARWWLNATLAAPAWEASACCCSRFGSSANLNVTARVRGTPVAERNGSVRGLRRGTERTVPQPSDTAAITYAGQRPAERIAAVSVVCRTVARMPRQTVKLLLVDPDGRLLLVHGRDPATGTRYWYPVGGGVKAGESLNEAADREAWEETGFDRLPVGAQVWTRDVAYTHAGRTFDVHEDWLHHVVAHFDPAPGRLTDRESESILGFRWWTAEELRTTRESVFPPDLGTHLSRLQERGCPAVPIDIWTRASTDVGKVPAADGAVRSGDDE
jgi:8-oxo-dGTP pyrophosphatase MutT (NUDIX family)